MRRTPRSAVTALVVGTVALALLGCAGERRAARNLLLVTIDTLRADRVGSYGYAGAETPHLDGLAERGLRFAEASTVMPLTLPAHASLMTGTFPPYHGVRDNGGFYLGDDHETLAEVLAASGYRTGGFVGAFVLDSRWGIAQGFEDFYDDFDLTRFADAAGMDAIQRPGSAVVDRALDWLGEGRGEPFFAWVHLYDPHTPYSAPEPLRSRFPATRSGAYDAEVAAADLQLGRLLAAVAADGRLEETLVVVLGDHGEMLGDHQEPTHGFFIYRPAIRIPLLLAGPGIPAGVVAAPVRIVDVLPTLLAHLEMPAPPAVQGVDLMPLVRGERLELLAFAENWFPRYHYGWSELVSIQRGSYKLIRAPRRELYDLDQDPGERVNLARQDPRRADALERVLADLLERVSAAEPQEPRPIDPETRERLEALGYLGGGSGRHPEPADGAVRGDPKDKIGLYTLMKEATAAAAGGELEQAMAIMGRVLAVDSEIVEAHMLLGNFRRKAGRDEAAVEAYRAALALDPEHREALYNLALAYKGMGRLDEALTGLERAAELDPRNGKVIWQMADVHMRQGRFELAEGELRRALDLDLDRPRFLLKLGECYLEMGRLDEAAARLEAGLAENPRLAGGHFTLALVDEARGRPAAAVANYESELEIDPEAFRASFNLAKLLQRGGPAEVAIPYFRRTVEIRPQFGTGRLYLAKALLDAGRLQAAEEEARRGLELHPDPEIAPLGHYVLADIYNRLGRTEEAARQEAKARRMQAEGGP